MLTHTTYKRLQCQICEKGYTTLNSLRKHLTSVHELKKDSQEYKEMFEKLANERTAFFQFQKQVDLLPHVEGTPIEKVQKKDKVVSGRQSHPKREEGCSSEAVSSSIGQRILRKDRKSRPKCLEELEVDSSSTDDEYTPSNVNNNNKWTNNSASACEIEIKTESENLYPEKFSDTEGNGLCGSLKNNEKSSKKRRVESIARVLKGRKTSRQKIGGNKS